MSRSRSNYGSGTYEKLPSGKMRLRTMVEMPDGTKKRKTFTGKTQADCRKALKVYTDSLHEPAPKKQPPTIAEWGDTWLAARKDSIVYGTYKNYKLYLDKHITPALGSVRVDHVNAMMIEQFLQTKRSLSFSAQKAIRTELRMILDSAVANDYMVKNPMVAVSPIRSPQEKTHFYGLDEIRLIIARCAQNPFGYAVLWLLSTGCRYEELAALKWTDIHDDGTLLIQRVYAKSEAGGWEIREWTKSRKTRTVALSETVQKTIPMIAKTSEYIFPNRHGKPMSYNTFHNKYKSFLQECGVKYLSPHACRHTYATQLVNQNVNLRVIQTALGHSSTTVTERYTHPDIAAQIEAANKLPY